MPRRRPRTAEVDVAALRVARTIRREQDDAKRHALKHGDALVCVRHRIDPQSNMLFVTVELVVETLPVASRDNKEGAVRLGAMQRSKRILVLACGATWYPSHRVWRMPRSGVRTLRLLFQTPGRPYRLPIAASGYWQLGPAIRSLVTVQPKTRSVAWFGWMLWFAPFHVS